MALSVPRIKSAGPGMHADGGGLYLRVQTGGGKGWIFRFQLNGRRREMGLGILENVGLSEARDLARKAATLVRSGVDPIEARNAAKTPEKSIPTFREAAISYIESHRAGWKNIKTPAQWENTLDSYAYPKIGNKLVDQINTADVLEILKPIWSTKTETATRIRNRIELVLSAQKALGNRSGENPAAWRGNIDALLPTISKARRTKHHPALAFEKTAAFLRAVSIHEGIGAQALKFVILTACRSGEARLATWQEIDFDNALWRIPGTRMKAARPHEVPLSKQAVTLLKGLPRFEGINLVFPSVRKQVALSDMTLTQLIRRMNEREEGDTTPAEWVDRAGECITVHGFRSTFRDWAGETTDFAREVIEHALAHQLPDKAEAAYARGTLFEKRRALMQAWADFIA